MWVEEMHRVAFVNQDLEGDKLFARSDFNDNPQVFPRDEIRKLSSRIYEI